MGAKVSKQSQVIIELLNAAGCISEAQAMEVLTKNSISYTNPNFKPESVLNFLVAGKFVKRVAPCYITNLVGPKASSEAIDCVWVMLDQLVKQNNIGEYYNLDDFFQLIEGDSMVELSYVQDNDIIVNLVELSSTSVSKMIMLQQRFYAHTNAKVGEEKKYKILHVVATRDKNTAKALKKLDLNIPYKVAYLEYADPNDSSTKPEITYL